MILPVITDIVNRSLDCAVMPEMLKIVQIRPHLKKANLDDEIFKNFRPVSNLALVSKVIEKAVSYQLIEHVDSNDLGEPLQLAYKSLHKTETALLKVQHDILNAIDQRRTVLLFSCYWTCPQRLTQLTTSYCFIDSVFILALEARPLLGLPLILLDVASMLLSEVRILLLAV